MRILIEGEIPRKAMIYRPVNFEPTEIVCATENRAAKEYARELEVACKEFWQNPTPRGGLVRINAMVHYSDAVIAVWDGRDTDTRNLIRAAVRSGLPVFIWPEGDER